MARWTTASRPATSTRCAATGSDAFGTRSSDRIAPQGVIDWFRESSMRIIERGDMVSFDTHDASNEIRVSPAGE